MQRRDRKTPLVSTSLSSSLEMSIFHFIFTLLGLFSRLFHLFVSVCSAFACFFLALPFHLCLF
jgi:hypothetical protein